MNERANLNIIAKSNWRILLRVCATLINSGDTLASAFSGRHTNYTAAETEMFFLLWSFSQWVRSPNVCCDRKQ